MDQKAGFLLAAVGVLTASLWALAKDLVLVRNLVGIAEVFRELGTFFLIAYLVLAFSTFYWAARVFGAVAHKVERGNTAPGLIFPLIILQRCSRDELQYFTKMRIASTTDMLRDYCNQIMEISAIYESKHMRINVCQKLFRALAILWVVTILAFTFISCSAFL